MSWLYLLQLLLRVEELRHAADELRVHEERLAVAEGGGGVTGQGGGAREERAALASATVKC